MAGKERLAIGMTLTMVVLFVPGFLLHAAPRFPGSLIGGVLGIAGALLFVLLLAYSLIRRIPWLKRRASLRAMLLRRLDGVVQRQDRKLLMFRASEDRVDALAQLLADAEPLVRLPADGGALRLQTMCPGPLSWQRMEELERAGAQGLMVLSVERSLA